LGLGALIRDASRYFTPRVLIGRLPQPRRRPRHFLNPTNPDLRVSEISDEEAQKSFSLWYPELVNEDAEELIEEK